MKKAILFFAITAIMSISAIAQNSYISTDTYGYCASTTTPVIITAQLHGYSGPVSRQWKQKINGVYQNIVGSISDTLYVTTAGTYGIVYSTPAGSTIAFSNGVCVTECTTVPISPSITLTGVNQNNIGNFQYISTVRCRYFLQVSTDSSTFHDIREVSAYRCIEPLAYTKAYYRIRGVVQEIGPTVEQNIYSNIISFKRKNRGDIEFFPNPTHDFLYIKGLTNNTIIRLTATNGQNVLEYRSLGNASLYIKSLPAGMYSCTIRDEETGTLMVAQQIIKK